MITRIYGKATGWREDMDFLLWIGLLLIGFALGCYQYEKVKTGKNSIHGEGSSDTASEKIKAETYKWMNPDTEKWVVLTVLMVAFLIRFWNFGAMPYGMNQDEAMAAVDAKALADYGTDRFGMYMPVHFTAWGYGQMSVLLSYCMVPFIKLFGFHAISVRLPLLIFSMLGIWAAYRIALVAFDRRTAFFVLLICAINPWHFMQSRWAMDCNMFPHVFILGVMFLLMGVKKRRYLYLSMVFFALCMYCYGIALYTVPVFLLIMCVYLLRKRVIVFLNALICVGVYLFISWPFLLTMAINTFKWDTIETPLFTIPYFKDSVRSKDILFFSEKPLVQLWENLKSIWKVFVEANGLSCNYVEGYAPVFLFLLPFGILGMVLLGKQCFQKKNKQTKKIEGQKQTDTCEVAMIGKVAVLSFLLIGFMAGILTNYVNVNRINIIFYPVILLCGLGISFVVDYAKRWSLALIPMGLVLSIAFLAAYFGRYAQDYKAICYTDFMEAVAYLEETECTTYVITPDSQYYGAYNVSEIMTLYTQKVDARYFQNLYPDEHGLFYREKYIYARAQEVLPYAPEGTGYVISSREADLLTGVGYQVISFGNYAVAIP